MKILAIELSTARGSIAFTGEQPEPFAAEFANDRKHSGAFFEELRNCIRRFGAADQIAVGLGPGSYAGTRIGIAAANGLRAAFDAQLVGVPSVFALPAVESEYIIIGDARRHTFHLTHVSERRSLDGPLLCNELELRGRLASTELPIFSSEILAEYPDVRLAYPSALVVAEIAAAQEIATSAEPLEPIYLRDPHITQPKPKRSLVGTGK